MTIECYLVLCPNHSLHDGDPDEGPFCFQQECTQKANYIRYIEKFQATAAKHEQMLKIVPLIPVKFTRPDS